MQYVTSYRRHCGSLGMQFHSTIHPTSHFSRHKHIAQIVLQQSGDKAVMPTHHDMDHSQGTCTQSVRALVLKHKLACMPSDTLLLGWQGWVRVWGRQKTADQQRQQSSIGKGHQMMGHAQQPRKWYLAWQIEAKPRRDDSYQNTIWLVPIAPALVGFHTIVEAVSSPPVIVLSVLPEHLDLPVPIACS